MKNRHIARLLTGGLLIAFDILFTRFLSWYTPGFADRLSLQFIPNGLAGLLLGPAWGFVTCAAGDVLGMMVFPTGGGSFMPLITLAAGLRGLVYGLILHNRTPSMKRIVAAVAVVTAFVELLVMPFALSVLYSNSFPYFFIAKLPTRLVTIPVYGLLLFTVVKALRRSGFVRLPEEHPAK